MERDKIEKLLRQYGRKLPADRLFSEEEDRILRERIAEEAWREEEADVSAARVEAVSPSPPSRRSERYTAGASRRRLLAAAGVLAAAAAVVLLATYAAGLLRRESEPRQVWEAAVLSGLAHLDAGRYEAAEADLVAASDELERGDALDDPTRPSRAPLARVRKLLGDTSLARGRINDAEAHYDAALELRLLDFPVSYLDAAKLLVLLGDIAQQNGDLHRAHDRFAQLAEIFVPLAHDEPDQGFFQEIVAMGYERQGDLARRLEERDAPREYYERYTELYESGSEPVRDTPLHPLYLRNLAVAYNKLADLAERSGDLMVARDYVEKAAAVERRVVEAEPGRIDSLRDLTDTYERLARLSWRSRDLETARSHLDQALRHRAEIVASDSANAVDREALASVHAALGDLALQSDRSDETAMQHYEEFTRIYAALAEANPATPDYVEDLAIGYGKLADIAVRRGDSPGAVGFHRQIVEIAEQLSAAEPLNPRYRETLAVGYARLGELARAEGDLDGALARFEAVAQVYESLAEREPANLGYLEQLSAGYGRLGDLSRERSDPRAALQWFRLALAADERLARMEPENPIYREMLLTGYERAGTLGLAANRADVAAEYFGELLGLREESSGPDDVLTAWARALLGDAQLRGGRRDADVEAMHQGGPGRADFVELESLLTDALRVFDRKLARDHPWRRSVLESLETLYGPEFLDYPRKRRQVASKLAAIR